ncbi:hypothetical protein HDU80_008729 [Chytriomyces hyalinus]|nr:hypothetical protein HDU80_008729 [Chytriomyces hyalinus]
MVMGDEEAENAAAAATEVAVTKAKKKPAVMEVVDDDSDVEEGPVIEEIGETAFTLPTPESTHESAEESVDTRIFRVYLRVEVGVLPKPSKLALLPALSKLTELARVPLLKATVDTTGGRTRGGAGTKGLCLSGKRGFDIVSTNGSSRIPFRKDADIFLKFPDGFGVFAGDSGILFRNALDGTIAREDGDACVDVAAALLRD